MFGLCDCNNFYVSCERVFNPSLCGRPTIVLSGNDGCVIARSNESKALGIKMGQPYFQVLDIVKRNDVAVFSTNFPLYGDMSKRVMETLSSLVPQIEIYSIDEAFLNLDGMDVAGLAEYGRHISRTVNRHTGIPVSIGIAPTKTLAKVASKLCKQYPKLQGCCLMYRPEDITKVLTSYPIEDIWGIGRRYAKVLHACGVNTADDFRRLSPEWVKARMGVVGLRTWNELHSTPCIEFEHAHTDRQTICVSRSFVHEFTAIEPLQQALSTFLTRACEKLRRQNSVASQMQVFIHTNKHRLEMPQHCEGRLVNLSRATDSTIEMMQYVTAILRQLFREGYAYKRAGVVLSGLEPKNGVQNDMFDTVDRNKHSALMQTVDTLNKHLGQDVVALGSAGGSAKSHSKHRSPSYTTSWDDIIKVKV